MMIIIFMFFSIWWSKSGKHTHVG